ncbi:dephospho-CoA kinase [Flavobacteriaceae bacterium 3-367]|uniref:dephospho-CoA kinase n=1 Tax=Eudoraea algarum TaxID=3417568 RepID=UPI003291D4CF
MMIVGLTGGIGSGKTTVAEMFIELGIPVYDSDFEAKRLMQSSKKLKKAIIALFGKEAYTDKKLNKTYISSLVFKDGKLLKKLNAIVHPAVKKHFKSWAKKQKTPYVIQEAAIIFENASHESYDRIILVTSPQNIRIQRVINRDGHAEEKIRDRMRNQWEDAKKATLADFVIENVDIEKTKLKVREIHKQLLGLSQ